MNKLKEKIKEILIKDEAIPLKYSADISFFTDDKKDLIRL